MESVTGNTICFFHPNQMRSEMVRTNGIIVDIYTNRYNELVYDVQLTNSDKKGKVTQIRPRLKTIWPKKILLTERITA